MRPPTKLLTVPKVSPELEENVTKRKAPSWIAVHGKLVGSPEKFTTTPEEHITVTLFPKVPILELLRQRASFADLLSTN